MKFYTGGELEPSLGQNRETPFSGQQKRKIQYRERKREAHFQNLQKGK
jgi:hypothetical protein